MKYILLLLVFLVGCEKKPDPGVECTFYQDIKHWLDYHENEEIEILSDAGNGATSYFYNFTGSDPEFVDFVLSTYAPKCKQNQYIECGQTARNNITLICRDY